MGKRLLREPEVCERLGCGATTLEDKFIKTKRLRWVYPSERIKAAVEDEVDALVEQIIAERDAAPSKRSAPVRSRERQQSKT